MLDLIARHRAGVYVPPKEFERRVVHRGIRIRQRRGRIAHQRRSAELIRAAADRCATAQGRQIGLPPGCGQHACGDHGHQADRGGPGSNAALTPAGPHRSGHVNTRRWQRILTKLAQNVHHPTPDSVCAGSTSNRRNAARPSWVWLFTVPGETLRISATSSTERSRRGSATRLRPAAAAVAWPARREEGGGSRYPPGLGPSPPPAHCRGERWPTSADARPGTHGPGSGRRTRPGSPPARRAATRIEPRDRLLHQVVPPMRVAGKLRRYATQSR